MPRKAEVRSPGRMVHVRLSNDTHRLLRVKAAELDTSIQAWVEEMIEKALKVGGKGGAKS